MLLCWKQERQPRRRWPRLYPWLPIGPQVARRWLAFAQIQHQVAQVRQSQVEQAQVEWSQVQAELSQIWQPQVSQEFPQVEEWQVAQKC